MLSVVKKAFALPSIVIASVIMMSVLSITMASISASRTSVSDQKYTQLAQLAAESGQSYAKACLSANSNVAQWSNSKPLKPNTDCSGNETTTCSDSSTNPLCFVLLDSNIKSTFSVQLPTLDSSNKVTALPSTGTVKLIRSSSGLAWKTYNQSIGVKQQTTQEQYNEATGGTITEFISTGQTGTTIGKRYRVHTFTSSGTLNITKASKPFDVLVLAGGGGGGHTANPSCCHGSIGSGAGAGGLILQTTSLATGSVNIVVGGGGASGGGQGGNSILGSLIAYGGGGGLNHTNNDWSTYARAGISGGSGGGGLYGGAGGSGVSGQGNSGGTVSYGGGGGGAGAAGIATYGGTGRTVDITGASIVYATGGDSYGGGGYSGGSWPANLGNGGHAGYWTNMPGWVGSSGVVIVRYEIDSTSTKSIVANGLVLYLDAGDSYSYPGSGTVWRDLAGIMGDVNINSRNYDWSFVTDSATGQKALYNGTNRTDGNSPGINVSLVKGWNKAEGTIELLVKPIDTVGGIGFFVNSDGSDYTNNQNWFWWGGWDNSTILYFRQGNASTCCNDLTLSNWAASYYSINTWQQWVLTWKVSSGTAYIYKNGVLLASTTSLPTNISTTANPTQTGQLFNNHERTDNMQFKGYNNIYRIYNRQLSQSEIQQNFNAVRSRYGI